MPTSVAGWHRARRTVTVALAVRTLRPGAAVALLALLVALAGTTPATAQQPGVPTPAATPARVRVMTFNIWLGGDVVDFGKVIDAITAARADIVGLQEAEGNTRRTAEALHWPYWCDRLHVVSRFPLIDPARGEGRVRARADPAV
jgi:hypothetical protein